MMKYEEMKPHEIEAARDKAPIAYLPWGAHEWHGPHNAVGLDTIKAYHQCLALCAETGGVVLPPIYCGYQTMKPWRGFGHTLEFRRSTVQAMVTDYLHNLYEEGFAVVVIVMGHYGGKHIEAIREACQEFLDSHSLFRVWAFPDYEPVRERGFNGDHAGVNETSLLMHFRPDLVDLSLLPEEFDAMKLGTSSDPRQGGSPEHGAELLAALVEVATPKIRELLDEVCELRRQRYADS